MDHTTTMRRLYELLNAGDIDGFGDHMADDFIEHDTMPGLEPSKDGVKQMFRMYRASFPDMHMEAEDIMVAGDKVVTRGRVTGTHTGDAFMGLPTTGKRVTVELIDIIRFDDDGQAREHWGLFDSLGLLQQLGAIPAAPVAPTA